MAEEMKVRYARASGNGTSTAYVDEETLIGTDKHSDAPLALTRDENGSFSQIDDGIVWFLDERTDEWFDRRHPELSGPEALQRALTERMAARGA